MTNQAYCWTHLSITQPSAVTILDFASNLFILVYSATCSVLVEVCQTQLHAYSRVVDFHQIPAAHYSNQPNSLGRHSRWQRLAQTSSRSGGHGDDPVSE